MRLFCCRGLCTAVLHGALIATMHATRGGGRLVKEGNQSLVMYSHVARINLHFEQCPLTREVCNLGELL